MGSQQPNNRISGLVGGARGALDTQQQMLNAPAGGVSPTIADLVGMAAQNQRTQTGMLNAPAAAPPPMAPPGAPPVAQGTYLPGLMQQQALSGQVGQALAAPQGGMNVADIIRQIRMLQGAR